MDLFGSDILDRFGSDILDRFGSGFGLILKLQEGYAKQVLKGRSKTIVSVMNWHFYIAPVSNDVYWCAAKAFYDCPAIIRLRPRSQNILKEAQLNPEKDSRIKKARSHVSLEKSS